KMDATQFRELIASNEDAAKKSTNEQAKIQYEKYKLGAFVYCAGFFDNNYQQRWSRTYKHQFAEILLPTLNLENVYIEIMLGVTSFIHMAAKFHYDSKALEMTLKIKGVSESICLIDQYGK